MPIFSFVAVMTVAFAQADTFPGHHILLSRTHPNSGRTRLELACPAAKTAGCTVRRYVSGGVVAEETVERAKSEGIFKEFLNSTNTAAKTETGSGHFVRWDVAYGARLVSGAITRGEKLARPVISLEAELLALVRKR